MKKLLGANPIIFFVVLTLLSNTSCRNRSTIDAQISNTLKISASGVSDNGDAVWVTCSGHDSETIIVVNGIMCTTQYFPDHLTCLLPSQFANKTDFALDIELYNKPKKSKQYHVTPNLQTNAQPTDNGQSLEIEILSSGFGGENDEAIWVQCRNHSNGVTAEINGYDAETTFYEDHITASIPSAAISLDTLSVKLTDKSTGAESVEFTIKKQ